VFFLLISTGKFFGKPALWGVNKRGLLKMTDLQWRKKRAELGGQMSGFRIIKVLNLKT